MNDEFVVVGCHEWTRRIFEDRLRLYSGSWTYIDRKENLTVEALSRIDPRAVFFLHWSWKVQESITRRFECIGFHMTDLPYGRGGTPLQNLILRGHKATKLSAFRLTDEMDAGPVYLKDTLSLEGSAQEIYYRSCRLAAQMIQKITEGVSEPSVQTGTITTFERRTPEQSELPSTGELNDLYDFIRMLDAEGYPQAFLECGRYRLEFSDAIKSSDMVTARVRIKLQNESDDS